MTFQGACPPVKELLDKPITNLFKGDYNLTHFEHKSAFGLEKITHVTNTLIMRATTQPDLYPLWLTICSGVVESE
jgi:hypothetical protein